MARGYQARHRRSSPDRGRAPGPAPARRHSRHQPFALAAVVVVVAGAAGYASAAKPHISAESFTASPAALAEARRSGVQRAYARTKQQKVPARVPAAARDRASRAFDRARKARKTSAERAVRNQARQRIIARARSEPRAVARLLVADKGWGGEQFGCLDRLWTKESGWSWEAGSSRSGPYGIPQSFPGSKMASAGGDWATNPVTQIKWGLKYISNSYGTPCSAWARFKSTSSY